MYIVWYTGAGVLELEAADRKIPLKVGPSMNQSRVWHLVKTTSDVAGGGTTDTHDAGHRSLRLIPEIFLTRIVTTKVQTTIPSQGTVSQGVEVTNLP